MGEALQNGAISVDTFRKAIAAMDNTESKTMSLQKALVKNNKTLDEFEKALLSTSKRRDLLEGTIRNFGSLEAAIRNGAITTEDFKRALESLGIDSEGVTQTVEDDVRHATGSLERRTKSTSGSGRI